MTDTPNFTLRFYTRRCIQVGNRKEVGIYLLYKTGRESFLPENLKGQSCDL